LSHALCVDQNEATTYMLNPLMFDAVNSKFTDHVVKCTYNGILIIFRTGIQFTIKHFYFLKNNSSLIIIRL